MSRYSGRQHRGARRDRKTVARQEAEERNAKTPPERTRQYRRVAAAVDKQLGA